MPPMETHVFITEAEWEGRVPSLLPRSPFWNTAVYNLFSRFSEDVATRRAAS